MNNTDKTFIPFVVALDSIALDYLRPKGGLHEKRFDCYCDLLCRAAYNAQKTVDRAGVKIDLKPGQFATTMLDLSRDWCWHRESVKKFLERIESMGLAQVTPYGKFIVITMSYTNPSKAEQPRLMTDEERRILRWACGFISVEDLINNCVEFFQDTETIFSPVAKGEQPSKIGERLHKMMAHLMLHHTNLMPYNREIGKSLDALFNGYCRQDMTRFWELLAAYGLRTLFTELPTDQQPFLQSKDAIPREAEQHLKKIANYYLPYLRQGT